VLATRPTGSRIIGIAIALYLVVVLAGSIYFRMSLTPDRVLILILIAALGTGRVRQFFKDWSIFLVVVLAWQFLGGASGHITRLRPHVTEMIVADKAMFFGQVPTIWLQHRLYHPGHTAWYDVAAVVLYLLHFVVPMVAAFAFWMWNRAVFLEFMVAFLLLALAGFATYVLYPAAPPWYAANWLFKLPHVYEIKNHVSVAHSMSISGLFSWMWDHVGWDRFGAIPSEHASFPFLCFLYARRAWRRAGWLVLPYCLAVWVAVVYMGEHYAIDVVVGVVYAALAYAVVRLALGRHVWPEEARTDPVKTGSISDTVTV